MLALALLLLSNSLFLSLHLAQNTGSFPKPLSASEEREYLRRAAAGDMDARNKLVEHNLRLVAHIVKNGVSEGKFFPACIRRPAFRPALGGSPDGSGILCCPS